MKWTSPQCVSALGSLLAGFVLIYLDFFLNEQGEIHDNTLWVMGQAFIYASAIFGVKGYIDGKFIKFKKDITDNATK